MIAPGSGSAASSWTRAWVVAVRSRGAGARSGPRGWLETSFAAAPEASGARLGPLSVRPGFRTGSFAPLETAEDGVAVAAGATTPTSGARALTDTDSTAAGTVMTCAGTIGAGASLAPAVAGEGRR